jgi:hypothetical protein
VEFFFQFGTQLGNGTHVGPPSRDCAYKNPEGNVVSALSERQLCFGDEYFGRFTRAWYSLFQVRVRVRGCDDGEGCARGQ